MDFWNHGMYFCRGMHFAIRKISVTNDDLVGFGCVLQGRLARGSVDKLSLIDFTDPSGTAVFDINIKKIRAEMERR